jgi:hypothetical protein
MQMAAAGAGGDYQISRSLRFNSADSTYLSRTPASAGDRETWTWSGWVKRSALGATQVLFGAESGGTRDELRFDSGDTLNLFWADAASYQLISTQVFRDVGAWGHLVVAIDTSQATSTNRVKIYWNGIQITAFGTSNYPIVNFVSHINNNVAHNIGRIAGSSSGYFNGYLTEINFIDGGTPSTAVDADGSITGTPGATYLLDFGEFSATTGVWSPIRYAGSYGTNGFYLNFSDNSGVTAATLGADYSGNGNNWTPSGFSVTAGAGNDSLVDTPTQYGTDTGAGGEVRGNYCTLNPLNSNATVALSNGNLQAVANATNWFPSLGTIGMSSEKWYWEQTITSGTDAFVGLGAVGASIAAGFYPGVQSTTYSYYASNGNKYNNNSNSAYGATWTLNDVIGTAFDADAGTLTFYKNGVSQGTAFSGIPANTYLPMIAVVADTLSMNFGQRPFAYTAPSGFKALVTTNLPEPTVVQGDDYFNTVLYTGDGSNPRGITGVGFQPDFVWLKNRSAGWGHRLSNAVVGANYALETNNTNAELFQNQYGYLTSFNSDGFTVTAGVTDDYFTNNSGDNYVAWNWKADGAGASNGDGTISSTVSVSTTSGFSIVTYTGNGGNAPATIGHGLGVAPKMMILKFSDAVSAWSVYHASLGNTKRLTLNTTDAENTSTGYWNNTSPTSTVFTVGIDFNQFTPYNYVVYCFAAIPGFSAFGSYTANGLADGPFVYTGFRPAWILFKVALGLGGESWTIYDTKRGTYNVMGPTIFANLSNGEATNNSVDVLSNGFKLRSNSAALNYPTATMIFAAFAEFPFKNSLAR